MMNKTFQSWLIGLYKSVVATGVLSTSSGRFLFEKAYLGYKSVFEAKFVDLLHGVVRPGTSIIDVGANIGFFTLKFGHWVYDGGKVIAIEPEALNYTRLKHAVTRKGLDNVVETLQAAVAEKSGVLVLEINPLHPGDHKLGSKGIVVTAFSIDDLLAARGWPPVSLIKIDVQGAEARVIAGTIGSIRKFHPALFVEIDDATLKLFNSSAMEVFTMLSELGYSIHLLEKKGISEAIASAHAYQFQKSHGYTDFLFIHQQNMSFTSDARFTSSRY
jgi:FkbM family methyltransferase